MAATPPPVGRIHTPPAPLHGAMHDSYEPYSPRRSRRVLERQQKSPGSDVPSTSVRQRVNRAATPPAKTVSTRNASPTFSPPSSPASPRTHKSSPKKNATQKSGVLISHAHTKSSSLLYPNSSIDPTTSLPTPSKTPRKKKGPSQAALSSTSRVLFANRPAPVEDAMPTPRKSKHSRKHSAYGLDGSVDEHDADASDNVEIYTDSKERVPVKDQDEENPFVHGDEQSVGKIKRPSKRRRGQSSSDKRMEEAVGRGEGLLYVFRGKPVFRSFDDSSDGAAIAETTNTDVQRAAGSAAHKPITRSNLKPRLLFPTKAQAKAREEADEDDLEAPTDIDERLVQRHNGAEQKLLSSEDEAKGSPEIVTPVKQDFSPATPPSTVRATRSSAKKEHDASPLAHATGEPQSPDSVPARRKRPSPFDKWPRAKTISTRSVSGTKREAEPMEKGNGAAGKRTRSGAASTS